MVSIVDFVSSLWIIAILPYLSFQDSNVLDMLSSKSFPETTSTKLTSSSLRFKAVIGLCISPYWLLRTPFATSMISFVER